MRRAFLLLLFVLHALPFLTRPVLLGGDEPHFALVGHSLAVDGDLDLADDYRAVAEGSAAAGERFRGKPLEPHVRPVGDRELPAHPLGLPVVVAPLLRLLEVGSPGAAPDLLLGFATLAITFGALLAGRRLLVEWLGDERLGTTLALALHFATPLWFTSRTFFTEPWLASLLVLAVYAWKRERTVLAGVLLGATFLIKESALVLLVPVVWGLGRGAEPERRWRLAIGPLAAAVVFVVKNLVLAGEALATYHPFELGDPLAGAFGLLVDPRHGLLPFAPLVLLAVLGLPRTIRGPGAPALLAFLALYGLTAAWVAWGGGSCFGPRLLVPALPALAVPLGEAFRRHGHREGFRLVFRGLAAVGFGLELAAAVEPFAAFWEISVPVLIGNQPWAFAGGLLLALLALPRLLPPAAPRAV